VYTRVAAGADLREGEDASVVIRVWSSGEALCKTSFGSWLRSRFLPWA